MPVRLSLGSGSANLTRTDDSQDTRMVEPRQPKFTAVPDKMPAATAPWHFGRSILSSLRIETDGSQIFCTEFRFFEF
jgi:hypothetical protein